MTAHVKATARYVHVAPNKVRQIAMHIRGRSVVDARRLLQLSPKAISEQVLKTLNSAVANAENNHDLDGDDLFVTSVIVNEGPQMKRFQPRAMGRAYRIRKRTSHITISVSTDKTPPPRENRNSAANNARGRRVEERAVATSAATAATPAPASNNDAAADKE